MSKPRVVLTHWVHPQVIHFLEQSCEVVPNTSRSTLPRQEILKRAAQAKGLMVFMPDTIDAAFLDACPELEIVGAALKGFDNFDVDAATRRGIWFSNVPDLLTIPTAELALALMLGLARHVLPGDRHVRSGEFHGWRPTLYGQGMTGRTVGLIGMGAVGQALAQRLAGFGTRILYYDINPLSSDQERRLNVEASTMARIVSESDYLLPLTPLTPETLHLVGENLLTRVKPGCLLVNVCRGSVVDEGAVVQALEDGHLGGYAADVFELEDWALADRPRNIPAALLRDRERTLFTPHIGSAVDDVRLSIAMEAAVNITQALSGQRPQGAVNNPRPA